MSNIRQTQVLSRVDREVKGNIVDVLWDMKKQGLEDCTINFTRKALNLIAKYVDLNDPESVKEFIAKYDSAESYKRNLCYTYKHYLKAYELSWNRPKYHKPEKLPKIPTNEKIDMIISASRPELALKLLISKETGLRPLEVVNLKVRDVDLETGNIYPSTAKHGSGRTAKVRQQTLQLIENHIAKYSLGINDRLFGETSESYGKSFRTVRNKVAKNTGDPSIKSIRLYDLRHFYATMLYHRTRDILFVKQQMGHRKIETTLRYTQLINFEGDEYTVKVASTLEECAKLLEDGFEYITDFKYKKLFRKRK